MKKKLFIISIIITIIGIIVVATKGFNVELKYRAHKAINIPIGKEFNLEDIKAITNEVFANEKVELEKAGLYNDELIINVINVNDEQIKTLTQKINEKYAIKQDITISIGEEYEVEDVKTIAKEVFGKEDVNVEKNEDDATYVVIEAELITEEKLEELNSKINEKYSLQNTTDSIGISKVVTIDEIGRVRLSDMAKQYIKYPAIATVLILLYFAIRFKKLGISKVLIRTILSLVIAEFLYMAIIAITRYPINNLAIVAAIAIYLIVVAYLSKTFIKEAYEKQVQKK